MKTKAYRYVKIVKCSDPVWWYRNRIGDVFKVVYYTKEDYEVDSPEEAARALLTVIDCIESTEEEYNLQEYIISEPKVPENHNCLIHLIKNLDNGN